MKVPQFVIPRTTPPAARTMFPVVRVILYTLLGSGMGRVDEEDGLFDLIDAAAGADLFSSSA